MYVSDSISKRDTSLASSLMISSEQIRSLFLLPTCPPIHTTGVLPVGAHFEKLPRSVHEQITIAMDALVKGNKRT
jgi:hypothetical protein